MGYVLTSASFSLSFSFFLGSTHSRMHTRRNLPSLFFLTRITYNYKKVKSGSLNSLRTFDFLNSYYYEFFFAWPNPTELIMM